MDANPAALELFGLSREEVLSRKIMDFAPPEAREAADAAWETFLKEGTQTGRYRLRRPDGELRDLEFTARAHFRPGRHLSALRDVSDRIRAEEAVQASEEYLRALVEHSADAITVIDAEGRIAYSSPSQQRMMGYGDESIGAHMFVHVHPDDAHHLPSLFDQLIAHPDQIVTTELRTQHRDGSWHVVEATATNLLDNPAVRGIVVNSRDITEQKRAEAQLIHNAFHDALTGLPNRALFMDRLTQAISRADRNQHGCAVLFLDLDRFKTINDSLGHGVGDLLLVEVGKRLVSCVQPGDTVARFGGDEFAILLEEVVHTEQIVKVANTIGEAFEASFHLPPYDIVSATSIGIAIYNKQGTSAEEVLRDADIAMYVAKRGGHDYALADSTMHAQLRARLELEADLRRALEQQEFELHYQPKMAMDGHRVMGVEALVRWKHPQRGMISPADFIPLAEETGLIVPLGEWVIRTACAQMCQWLADGLTLLFVAVNISARQFRQPNLVEMVRAILHESGLPPNKLCVEVTESLLMEDAEATVQVLTDLRALGLRALAIDDFGTGYSSLSYLQRFPVTELKIDRSFVQNLPDDPGSAALAKSIIALAHSLGLHVIAEGVETEGQRRFLEEQGCDRFQGYLASRPLPAQQLTAFVSAKETQAADAT